MRVLLAGPYPPEPSLEAAATLNQARRLVAEGHDVEVVSPTPGAAHRYARLTGPQGAWWLLRHRPGFDALVLSVGPTMPLRGGVGRLSRLLDCLALAVALRVWPRVSFEGSGLRGVPGSIGGRSGQLLWRRADEVVVPSEEDRAWLHANTAIPLDRITVADLAGSPGEGLARRWPEARGITRQAVMAEVRTRSLLRQTAGASYHPPTPPRPGFLGRAARRVFRMVFRGQADRVSRRIRRVGRAGGRAG